jgi:nucleotide-binding universal stress UspA family protein
MRILIATDGSEFSKAAIQESCNYIIPGKVEVKIVTVYEDEPLAIEPHSAAIEYYHLAVDAVRKQAADFIHEGEAEIRRHFPDENIGLVTEILEGPPDREIIDEARRWKADLIVVGSHGRGFWGRILGSVSTGIIHHAHCSVLVVRKRSNG